MVVHIVGAFCPNLDRMHTWFVSPAWSDWLSKYILAIYLKNIDANINAMFILFFCLSTGLSLINVCSFWELCDFVWYIRWTHAISNNIDFVVQFWIEISYIYIFRFYTYLGKLTYQFPTKIDHWFPYINISLYPTKNISVIVAIVGHKGTIER